MIARVNVDPLCSAMSDSILSDKLVRSCLHVGIECC